ncbi:MAG TPA: large conductance mechanosensitive channel protein MscL [Candidatus Saccharimonadia bacterium]|nr:large conductance mechanosensitive channel protein MscL [Candidatus Saccharimonadia bacterium]
MFKEFKQFLLRGNVVDLAVAVVIGGAFTGIVNALVKDIITPLIAAIGGKPDFSKFNFTVNHSVFTYGDFLNQLISFLIVAGVVFFLVVQPINKLIQLTRSRQAPADPTTRKCPECLSEIPLEARRCMYCTAVVRPESESKRKRS